MKMMKYMTCLATAFLALVACSDADDILSAYHSDPNAVHITAEVGKASADGFTRSNPLGDAEAQKKFNTDDEISVKADGQAAVTYKFNGTEWIPQDSKFLKWESETMNFTAYYPASYTGGTPTQPTVYTTVESLATADYMSFTGSQKNTGDNKLTLTMNRQMARVVVDIAGFNDQYAGATVNSINSLTIMGVKAYKHSDNKFYALMVPCEAKSTENFLSLKVGEGNTETLTGIPALEAGKSYTYDLTVGKNKVVVTGITVKDWTTDKIINGVAELDTRPYLTFKAEGEQTFKMVNNGYFPSNIEYSVNEGEWKNVVADQGVTFGGSNGTLRLRGTNPNGTAESFSNYSTINFTEDYVKVACTGDIRTLLDYRNYATVATDYARFCNLFRGCRALTTAPYLPAMVLADYCYQGMFQNCTNLETPPALPAETLADYCYQGMFFGCTDLKTAPVLPADTLTPACYNTMFLGCINLKTAPQLPATTLAVCCYQQMFQDCTNIETAPALPAETLAGSCYQGMFQRCKNLSSVMMMASSDQIKNAFNCCGNWLEGAGTNATSRTLKVKDEDAYDALVNKSYLPDKWKKGVAGTTVEDTPYLTFTAAGAQTFKMIVSGGYDLSEKFEYSVNGGEWNKVVADKGVAFGGANGTLSLRGTNLSGTAKDDNYFSTISFTNSGVKVACTGDIRTLLDYRNYKTVDTQNAKFCNLFENCTALTFAPKLPAETLASNCYSEMFSGCTNLNTAPELPATTLAEACYSEMFSGCTNLDTAPSLPATKLVENCYYNMFSGCTNLNTAPKLPATKLAYWCYYGMFNDCSSLTEAPILPAETLANGCYFYMFSGCKNLKTAPSLPATRLARYCYHSMFRGCTNLTSVTMLAPRDQITSKERCCDDWLNNAGTSAASRTLKVTDVDAYDALVSKGYLPADYWQKGKCSVSW